MQNFRKIVKLTDKETDKQTDKEADKMSQFLK